MISLLLLSTLCITFSSGILTIPMVKNKVPPSSATLTNLGLTSTIIKECILFCQTDPKCKLIVVYDSPALRSSTHRCRMSQATFKPSSLEDQRGFITIYPYHDSQLTEDFLIRFFDKPRKTWRNAFTACKQDGGELVTMETDVEKNAVFSMLRELDISKAWISMKLSKNSSSGAVWIDVNGQSKDFEGVLDTENVNYENECFTCRRKNNKGVYDFASTVSCYEKLRYICQKSFDTIIEKEQKLLTGAG